MRIEQIFDEWTEKYPNSKNLEQLIDYYKNVYSDKEIVDYQISENSIFVQLSDSVKYLKISFKLS